MEKSGYMGFLGKAIVTTHFPQFVNILYWPINYGKINMCECLI
jgi:hypothetical protein